MVYRIKPNKLKMHSVFLTLLFSLCSFILTFEYVSAQGCPLRCSCHQRTVTCLNEHLDRLPVVPYDTSILDLRFNRIQEIPSKAFSGLPHLHTIYLNENQVTTIHSKAFDGLPSLKYLYLNKNRVSKISEDAFQNLDKLKSLFLQNNNITTFDVEVFSNMPSLESLFLNNNKILNIPFGAFEKLPTLKRLRLDGNELRCDCSMKLFMKTVKTVQNQILIAGICQSPSNMLGKNVQSVILEDLHCTKPEITEEPIDTTINFGRSGILRCRASGHPEPKITWLKDSVMIPTNNSRIQTLLDGTLLLENFTSSDIGVYQCKAKNDIGEAISYTATIHEETDPKKSVEMPTIVLAPTDQFGLAQERIVLHCVAIGPPKPKISWYYNNLPVKQSNKIHIHMNGSLVITKLTEKEVGVYKCEASNIIGTQSAFAGVKINVHPRITVAPENQTLKTGDHVILQCESDGSPTPNITWKRDGRTLVPTNRIFFSNENSEIHIEHVKESDSGQYVCVAENMMGKSEAEASVTVQRLFGPPKLIFEPYDLEVIAGTIIEIPCKGEGDNDFQVKWKKDGRSLTQLPRYRFSTSGSLFISDVTDDDTGRYECSITNEYGRATASGVVTVRQEEILAPGDRFVRIAFAEASHDIDNAINQTIAALFSKKKDGQPRHHGDLFKLFNFPNAPLRELARAAEVYERTLINIRKYVDDGSVLTANKTNFNYTEVMSEEHLELVARLSGCTSHRIKPNCTDICYHRKYRSIDGTCNNLNNPTWGASLTGFRRILPPIYENEFSMPIGWTKGKLYNGFLKPSSRLISTTLIATNEITPDSQITHMMMQWGQFLDHDLDHALPSVSSESWDGVDCKKTCDYAAPCYPIDVPHNDPRVKNRRCIDFVRSSAICGSGMTSVFFKTIQPREQINQLTSYIDGSQVYGYSKDFAKDLRIEDGSLREGVRFPKQKAMLPFASPADGIDCRRDLDESNINCFVAGDIRVNEQIGLLAMHTIWFREHNRIAQKLRSINPYWTGDTIYNEARKIVGAQMQHITYAHWLPNILGPEGMKILDDLKGYNPEIDASISNEFATAALRFGHSLINPVLHRLDHNFEPIHQGHLPLGKAFFAPWRLVYEGGVDPLMRGLYTVPAKLKMPQQNLNMDLTEKLFQTAHAVALDLAAINIQRSRDHAIPGYNDYRRVCNMTVAETFDDLTEISSKAVREKLKEIYGHPSNIDIWVGGILEDQVKDGRVGPLFRCLLIEQFRRLRDGDRLWYENESVFKPEQLVEIKKTNFGRVLCDNGDNITRITDDVFILPPLQGGYKDCSLLPEINLDLWVDCSECYNKCDKDIDLNRQRREIRSKRETEPISVNATIFKESDLDNYIEWDMNEERIEGLEALVGRFEKSLKQIRRKMRKLEETCTPSHPKQHGHCIDDSGIRRLNNEVWSKNDCIKCECKHHQVNCTEEKCAILKCKNTIKKSGQCCPICITIPTTKSPIG